MEISSKVSLDGGDGLGIDLAGINGRVMVALVLAAALEAQNKSRVHR